MATDAKGGALPVAQARCGDFLAMISRKPEHLEFIDCSDDSAGQTRTLIARYRVNGEFAAGVERFLITHSGMRPLRFVCCGWEVVPVDGMRFGTFASGYTYTDGTPSPYEVSMGSDETLNSKREGWAGMDPFHVDVRLYLELP